MIDGVLSVPPELGDLLLRLALDIIDHTRVLVRHRTAVRAAMLQDRNGAFGLLHHAADARQHRVNVAPLLIPTRGARPSSIHLTASASTHSIPTRRRFGIYRSQLSLFPAAAVVLLTEKFQKSEKNSSCTRQI